MNLQAERTLQQEIMWRCGAYPLVVVPVPNGIWLPAHSEAEKAVVRRYVARLKAEGMLLPGAPDLICVAAGGAIFIEIKRQRQRDLLGRVRGAGQMSDLQIEFRRRCERIGVPFAVCRDWPEVKTSLSRIGV